MSAVTADQPARVSTLQALEAADHADHADHGHQPRRTWLWNLVEALAYAGASVDPTAALAAQRFARIRDEERRRGVEIS